MLIFKDFKRYIFIAKSSKSRWDKSLEKLVAGSSTFRTKLGTMQTHQEKNT